MPRRSKKVHLNKKPILQLNKNACDKTQNHVISHMESVGSLIIKELNGLERNHLKQQLLNSTINNNLPLTSSRRSLKQVLDEFHRFDCYTDRQHRTIGIGDHDINTNIVNDNSDISKRKIKRTSVVNSTEMIENDKKKPSNIITRTICTRSSKLNTNQEPITEVHLNRARKRRSSLRNNINIQNQNNHSDNKIEKSMNM